MYFFSKDLTMELYFFVLDFGLETVLDFIDFSDFGDSVNSLIWCFSMSTMYFDIEESSPNLNKLLDPEVSEKSEAEETLFSAKCNPSGVKGEAGGSREAVSQKDNSSIFWLTDFCSDATIVWDVAFFRGEWLFCCWNVAFVVGAME